MVLISRIYLHFCERNVLLRGLCTKILQVGSVHYSFIQDLICDMVLLQVCLHSATVFMQLCIPLTIHISAGGAYNDDIMMQRFLSSFCAHLRLVQQARCTRQS
jgi:hypothetical protein